MELTEVLGALVALVTGMLAWLWKGHENRLRALEETRQTIAVAAQQRAELREELKDFRMESSGRFVRVFEQLDRISERLPRS